MSAPRRWDGVVPPGQVAVMARPVGAFRDPRLAGFQPKPYSGSTKGRCRGCGCEVWIGPRAIEIVDAGNGLVVCMECVVFAEAEGRLSGAPMVNLGNPEAPGMEER